MMFSVIIPAYNAEKTLKCCLHSLQNQLFTDFEAIVVDDGSVDGTANIAKEVADVDKRFICIQQSNRGVSTARNRGISEAKGEFIVFLDSDDQYDTSYLQEFSEMIALYPDCDHFWCGFQSVDITGNKLQVCGLKNDCDKLQICSRNIIMSLHEMTLDAVLWNKVYRRNILEQFNIRMDENLSLGEDLLFNFAYLDVCRPKIVINNKPLYIYTKIGNDSLDSKYRVNLLEIYELLNARMLAYLKKWDVSAGEMAKYYNSVFFLLGRVLYNTYRAECAMTPKAKREFNNALMKSEQFQLALNQADCSIHPLYRCAYKIGKWELVRFLDCLVRIKGKLVGS